MSHALAFWALATNLSTYGLVLNTCEMRSSMGSVQKLYFQLPYVWQSTYTLSSSTHTTQYCWTRHIWKVLRWYVGVRSIMRGLEILHGLRSCCAILGEYYTYIGNKQHRLICSLYTWLSHCERIRRWTFFKLQIQHKLIFLLGCLEFVYEELFPLLGVKIFYTLRHQFPFHGNLSCIL